MIMVDGTMLSGRVPLFLDWLVLAGLVILVYRLAAFFILFPGA
jgi:hypothetical protein